MLIFTLLACKSQLSVGGENAALAFGGDGCVNIPLPSTALTSELTFELHARGAVDASYGIQPVGVWQGAFALAELEDGRAWFGDTNVESGVPYSGGFMDGQLHHLAGTRDAEGVVNLFVDGQRVGFATVGAGAPSSTLAIGCWPEQSAGFEGVIDEVRLSSTLRYTETFEPTLQPFEVDEFTTGLWHFDERGGESILDAAGSYDGAAFEVEWVESPLAEGAE